MFMKALCTKLHYTIGKMPMKGIMYIAIYKVHVQSHVMICKSMTSRSHWNPLTIRLLALNTIHKRSYLSWRLRANCRLRHWIIDTEGNSSFWRQLWTLSISFQFSTLLQKRQEWKVKMCKLTFSSLNWISVPLPPTFHAQSTGLWSLVQNEMRFPVWKVVKRWRLSPALSTLWADLSLGNTQEIFMSFKDSWGNSHYNVVHMPLLLQRVEILLITVIHLNCKQIHLSKYLILSVQDF